MKKKASRSNLKDSNIVVDDLVLRETNDFAEQENEIEVLDKVKKFYIKFNRNSMSTSDIATDLGIDESAVADYIRECVAAAETETVEPVKSNDFTVDKLMNVKNGYSVMSKQASEVGDATRKTPKPKDTGHIHRIR